MTTADEQRDLHQQTLDLGVTAKQFQMQSFQPSTGEWMPMENGAAGHIWRPRATAVDAAAKCLTWTGLIGIPAMQVIDLETGEVVWRLSDRYPQAGESIPLPPASEQLARARARKVTAEPSTRPSEHTDRHQPQASPVESPEHD